MLFAFTILLAHALAIQAYPWTTHQGDDIKALCARGKSVDLTKFSQLKSLEQAVNRSKCSATLKKAIPELVELIESSRSDLCSAKSINALRAYYGKYLDKSNSADKNKELLPSSLKKFVIAYGMQVSNLCKKNMIKILTDKSQSPVDASDLAQLKMLIAERGPVAQILGALGEPGDIFLPGDLVPFFKKHGTKSNDQDDKLILQTETAGVIKEIQSVCEHRFKPVYEPLMIPLVRLVNMGFNYKDEPLKCDLQCSRVAHEIGKWSRIVFGCELIANIRIVEQDFDQDLGEGSSSRLVRILTKEEADAIEGTLSQVADEELGVSDLVYTPTSKVALEVDEIYNKSDKLLKKSIKSFKTNRSEASIFKKRVAKKSLELIKKQLKGGHFGFILSAAWKGAKIQKNGVKSPSRQFVDALNDMIEQQGGNTDGAVSYDYYYDGGNVASSIAWYIFYFVIWAAAVLLTLHFTGIMG